MTNLLALTFLFFSFPLFARPVIFWLSVDGLAASYLEKAVSPNLDKLIAHAIYSKKLVPVFPSITFPSHCSQSTGVKVDEHGITANTFYDRKLKKVLSYPNDSQFLQAEPIWQTVKRGGLRSGVFDWPLSYEQTGKYKSDFSNSFFNKTATDNDRLKLAINIWEKENLDLTMAYIVGPDSLGHKFGPNSGNVLEVLKEVDRLIGMLKQKIIEEGLKRPQDEFFLLITSDHGMTNGENAVNFKLLSNFSEDSKIDLLPTGTIGHVFLDRVPERERAQVLKDLLNEYKKYSFLKSFEGTKLPKEWGYAHSQRVGDIVVVLEKGYAFYGDAKKMIVPMGEVGGPLGIHGYDAKKVKDMEGIFILWRYPELDSSKEVASPVDALDLHPTVAHLLKVAPSPKAKGQVLKDVQDLSR